MNARQSRRERSGHSNEFLPERKLITAYTAGLLFATVISCFIPDFQNVRKINIQTGNGPIQRGKEMIFTKIPKNVKQFSFGFENLSAFSVHREVIWYKALLTVHKHNTIDLFDNISIKSVTCLPSMHQITEIYTQEYRKPQQIDLYLWVKTTTQETANITFVITFYSDLLNTLKSYYYISACFVFLWVWFILQKYTCGSEDRKWFITIMKSYFIISSFYSLLHFLTTASSTPSFLYTVKIVVVSAREVFSIAYLAAIMQPLMPPTFSKKSVVSFFMFLMMTVFIATFFRQIIPFFLTNKKDQERLYSLCLGYRESIRITFFALVFLVGQAVRKKRMQNKYIVFHYMTFIPVTCLPLGIDFLMDVLHTKNQALHFICNELYDMAFIGLETIRLLPALKAMSDNSKEKIHDNSIVENAIQAIPVDHLNGLTIQL